MSFSPIQDNEVNRWKWRPAWNRGQTVLQGFLLGVIVSAISLLPLSVVFERMALLVVLLPLAGAIGGLVVWKSSAKYVSGEYREVLSGFYELQANPFEDEELWLTPLKETSSRSGLEPAATYTCVRVVKTAEEITMTDITFNLESLETTEQATVVPVSNVQSISSGNNTLTVEATTGSWNFEGIIQDPHERNLQELLRMTETEYPGQT